MFSKIAKSLKSFVKSDIGKVAIGVGSTFLLPGIGATAAASGTSLGGQILGGIKTFAGAAKAGTLGGKEGLLGLKGKIGAAQSLMGAIGGGGGQSSYGGGSTGYRYTASEGLTTYSPEGAAATQAPAAADYSAFLNESLQLYSYAESQGRKTT